MKIILLSNVSTRDSQDSKSQVSGLFCQLPLKCGQFQRGDFLLFMLSGCHKRLREFRNNFEMETETIEIPGSG